MGVTSFEVYVSNVIGRRFEKVKNGYIQHAQRDLARNHSGPTSVKSRKCRRNKKKVGVDTAKCPRKIEHGDLL